MKASTESVKKEVVISPGKLYRYIPYAVEFTKDLYKTDLDRVDKIGVSLPYGAIILFLEESKERSNWKKIIYGEVVGWTHLPTESLVEIKLE